MNLIALVWLPFTYNEPAPVITTPAPATVQVEYHNPAPMVSAPVYHAPMPVRQYYPVKTYSYAPRATCVSGACANGRCR